MSKQIKQMQMNALKATIGDVKDFVFLNLTGLDAIAENQFRVKLRKKKVRLHQVKNSLARRILDEAGIKLSKDSPYWSGPTTVAWGADSIAELAKTLDAELKDLVKKNAKLKDVLKVKGAITEGQTLTFEAAQKIPTRLEAIGSIVSMILGPASQIVSQIMAPASQIASQLQTIAEKKEEAPAAETPAPAAG